MAQEINRWNKKAKDLQEDEPPPSSEPRPKQGFTVISGDPAALAPPAAVTAAVASDTPAPAASETSTQPAAAAPPEAATAAAAAPAVGPTPTPAPAAAAPAAAAVPAAAPGGAHDDLIPESEQIVGNICVLCKRQVRLLRAFVRR